MKKLQLATLIVCVILLGLPVSAQAANLLQNPGFEDGTWTNDQSLPTDWQNEKSGWASWHAWKNDGQQHSGSKYIAVGGMNSNEWGCYKQNVSRITPGKVYIFSALVATEGWQPPSSPTAYLKVEFKDNKGTTIRTDSHEVLTGQNTTWSRKTLLTKPAPAGATNADFICYGQGKGTVLFDDVSARLRSR